MQPTSSAHDYLIHGDAIRSRVARDRSTVSRVAEDAGLSQQTSARASWLAGAYPARIRQELKKATLERLTPGHLEAVAALPASVRIELLRAAVADGQTVRELRRVAALRRAPRDGTPTSTIAELERSSRAMRLYANFSDRDLDRLVSGPNGSAIRTAARAGQVLAARIEEFTT